MYQKRTSLGEPLNHAPNNFENPLRYTKLLFYQRVEKNIFYESLRIYFLYVLCYSKFKKSLCVRYLMF